MKLSERSLNRATLDRQLLLERAGVSVPDATRRIMAIQAQHPASPYLALWNRITDLDLDRVDRAFADGALVKASLMRITLHVVDRDDHRAFRAAMLPSLRAAGFDDRRFTDTGMTVAEADALLSGLLDFVAAPRSRAEIEEHLAGELGAPPASGLWRALRFSAPWRHAPGEHPWSFGEPARFVALAADDDRVDDDGTDLDRDGAAVARVLESYLRAFGPATVRDVAQFTMLRQPAIRAGLDRLGEAVVRHGPSRAPLLDVADGAVPDEHTPAPVRLLPMWDNVLLAYADRRRVIDDDHRRIVIRRNGDVLPTVLVDGVVAGVWRPGDGGIEVTPLRRWSRHVWAAVDAEAGALGRLLADRERRPFARHEHWWKGLPTDGSRTIPPG